MIYSTVALTFFVVFGLVLVAHQAWANSKVGIKTRLNEIRDLQLIDDEPVPLSLPFRIRVIKPLEAKITGYLNRLLPANIKSSIEQKLVQCGNPKGLKADMFLTGIVLGAGLLTLLGFMIPSVLRMGLYYSIMTALLCLLLSVLIPVLWLHMTAGKRIRQVELALPDALDLLVVSVEAGLGFDMAMTKVTERMKGPLAEEFAKALNEMKMGKSRQAALRDLSNRVGSQNLSSFLAMVIQGTQMGVTLGRILRIQSETMRRERRQRAEETAMKAPIKMVFPLVFFIFPALFIVILGPAVIQIMKAFL